MWHGRYYVDVPGEEKRRKTSVPLGSIHTMKKTEAKRKLRALLEAMGLNDDAHLERTEAGARTVLPRFGTLPMSAIDERRVQEFIADLTHMEYKWPDGVSKKLSPKTIRNIVGVLKLILGERAWREWKLSLPEIPVKEQRCFSPKEMLQIINASTGQWKVLFATLASTGLRCGEAFGLHVEDLDLSANRICVRRSVWNGEEVSVKARRGYRRVNIEPALAEMLAAHLGDRKGGRVFHTRNGTPFSKSNVRRKLNQILKKLNLAPAGLHAFRHGRVSVLQANGVPGNKGVGGTFQSANNVPVHAFPG
jgi:integrase